MSAAVSNMMPVTLPRFAPSSASSSKQGEAKNQSAGAGNSSSLATQHNWGSALDFLQTPDVGKGGQGDPLDFDLLAEYLLEDESVSAGLGSAFDFSNIDFTNSSTPGVVSPEHVEDSGSSTGAPAPAPVAQSQKPSSSGEGVSIPAPSGALTGDLAHVQRLIAQQAAAAQHRISNSFATSTPAPATATAPALNLVPGTPTAPTPAPVPVPALTMPVAAPAPLAPAAPVPAPTGVAPIAAAPSFVFHQHGAAAASAASANALGNKRPRLDAGAGMIVNSHMFPPVYPHRGGRQKTQAQIDRRRERNRILARRTRLRKKFFFESLQKDVSDLQRENTVLKEIVKSKLSPSAAKAILDDCDAMEKLPDNVAEILGQGKQFDRQDFSLIQSIQKSQKCFVITDPSLQDNPIVYASEDFLTLTGYARDQVLGRNCRFLQGTETNTEKVETIRKAISNGDDVSVCLINYTADGTAFWNSLFIAALRDAENNIVNFIGVIVKVAGPDSGDPEYGKRLPGEMNTSEMDDDDDDGMMPDKASGMMDGTSGGRTADPAAMAKAAEGTVRAIEGAVTAAVAAAPSVGAPSAYPGPAP